MLIDKGADVNMQGGMYGNALQAALRCDLREVVPMLVDKGAVLDDEELAKMKPETQTLFRKSRSN